MNKPKKSLESKNSGTTAKPRLKEGAFTFRIPIYGVKVKVFVTSDRKVVSDIIKRYVPNDEGSDHEVACTTFNPKLGSCVIFIPKYISSSVIAHEVHHVADDVFAYIGAKITRK